MMERLALKDDKTTTGSSILGPSSSWYNEDGRAFALAEDLATCGNCKRSWRVGGTAHNWMDEGQAMVEDLDPVYCPCGKHRAFAGGSSPFFYSNDSASEPAQASTPARTHDEQFTLRDGKGRPLTRFGSHPAPSFMSPTLRGARCVTRPLALNLFAFILVTNRKRNA